MVRPTDSTVITLAFNSSSPPYSPSNRHQGVDYRAPTGANIYAPHSGKVTVASVQGACGLAVDIDGGRFKSRLCHNSQKLVNVGQQVTAGQLVAKAGATGSVTAAHCHWVLYDNGTRVDGSKYVNINQGDNKLTAEDKSWISTELNKRDKRLDDIAKSIDSLYKIVDNQAKADAKEISKLFVALNATNVRLDKLEKR